MRNSVLRRGGGRRSYYVQRRFTGPGGAHTNWFAAERTWPGRISSAGSTWTIWPHTSRLACYRMSAEPIRLPMRSLRRRVRWWSFALGCLGCRWNQLRRMLKVRKGPGCEGRWGIGAWTAQYIALRALGEPDAFPTGDLVLRRMAAAGNIPLTARALEVRAENWRPWRGYAVMHLWRAAADRRQEL